MGRSACGSQKVSNSLDLEIQVVVGCLMWIWEPHLGPM